MYFKAISILTVFLALFVQNVSAGIDMKDGMWEITSKMEMPEMSMQMPAVKFTQCLTSNNNVPQDKKQDTERNLDCKTKNTTIKGNTVTWEVHCISEGKPVKSFGRITYKGETFEGETKMEMDGMNMTQKMSGRRLGNCK